MLLDITRLKGLALQATDGHLGYVDQLFFDDKAWTIRYLLLDTAGWLAGRRVLISPISLTYTDWHPGRLKVSLTRRQVEDSPALQAHQCISRQFEAAYYEYYGYPNYWQGPYLWGQAGDPAGLSVSASREALADTIARDLTDSHLRSTDALTGYNIEAAGGEIGHVQGFVVDDRNWAIRYVQAATRNWWPGKKVLVSPAWIDRVSWADSKVYVGLSRDAIRGAPEYEESKAITREYEDRLYSHYGRPPYWLPNAGALTFHPPATIARELIYEQSAPLEPPAIPAPPHGN